MPGRYKADLILLDLMMPEMDGFEFVETVKRRGDRCDIPITAITAGALTPEERQSLSGNVPRVFGKPEHSGVSLDRVAQRRIGRGGAARAASRRCRR